MGKKLRFRSNESHPVNTSVGLDVLMFFNKEIFYEIDSKNQSCEKKTLQCTQHPLDIPDDATFMTTVNTGNPSIEGEGLKINAWTGTMPDKKGWYSMAVTMGCLPVSTFYFYESSSFLFSLMDIDNKIKDPDLLMVPSICLGQPLEETPEGTVHSIPQQVHVDDTLPAENSTPYPSVACQNLRLFTMYVTRQFNKYCYGQLLAAFYISLSRQLISQTYSYESFVLKQETMHLG